MDSEVEHLCFILTVGLDGLDVFEMYLFICVTGEEPRMKCRNCCSWFGLWSGTLLDFYLHLEFSEGLGFMGCSFCFGFKFRIEVALLLPCECLKWLLSWK